jgi:hypothetical protein
VAEEPKTELEKSLRAPAAGQFGAIESEAANRDFGQGRLWAIRNRNRDQLNFQYCKRSSFGNPQACSKEQIEVRRV